MNTKKYVFIAILLVAIIAIILFMQTPNTNNSSPMNSENNSVPSTQGENFSHRVTLQTNHGTIVFETYDADAPKASNNFITLAEKGFYDNLVFHRVISGFMIQGGDPKGDGTGGPGYTFEDELDSQTPSGREGYVRGTVAMANAGPNTNGSQFFIMHADYPLPHLYTIFGKVVSGMDAVDSIAGVETGANDRPKEPVVIQKVSVEKIK